MRKARRNKNFNLIQEVVLLWEEARRHDVTPEKRSKLVTAMLAKVQGRVAELAGSHAASRVIQTCAKHGTPAGARAALGGPGGGAGPRGGRGRAYLGPAATSNAAGGRFSSASSSHDSSIACQPAAVLQELTSCLTLIPKLSPRDCVPTPPSAERAAVLKELEPKLLELSKSPYGHFVVMKAVALAPKDALPGRAPLCVLWLVCWPPALLQLLPPPSPLAAHALAHDCTSCTSCMHARARARRTQQDVKPVRNLCRARPGHGPAHINAPAPLSEGGAHGGCGAPACPPRAPRISCATYLAISLPHTVLSGFTQSSLLTGLATSPLC